jgi:hypothetical protein
MLKGGVDVSREIEHLPDSPVDMRDLMRQIVEYDKKIANLT